MILMLTALLACGSTPKQEPLKTEPVVEKLEVVDEASPVHDPKKVAEALKLADLADGTEDNVAQKCAGCALSMDGDPAHALDVNGTTLHLCASMCKEYFSKDPEGNVVELLD